MPRLLVTGAHGQVGTELQRHAQGLSASSANGDPLIVHAVSRADLDITDADAVRSAVATVDGVVNAAAYTAVDRAEQDRDQAYAVNATAPGVLARQCASRNIPIIHISTDFVFDGTRATAWREDDPVAPLSVYGASKAAGEDAVRNAGGAHVIVRTSWVFSAHGHNFVKTMLRLGAERDQLRVVDDQIGLPTAASDLASTLIMIAQNIIADGADARNSERLGTFHYANMGATSWCGFARGIFEMARDHWGRAPVVHAIPSSDYPTPAKRPANSVLDCSRIERVFAVERRAWRPALAAILTDLFAEQGLESTP